jgi:hypothetical protein
MFGRRLLLAAFFIAPALSVLITQSTIVEAGSEECRAKPASSAPTGDGHWYYRIDRATQRRCWFLSSGDPRMRHTSSLKRRDLISGGTDPEIEEQPKLDDRTVVARPTPGQEITDGGMRGELAVPQFDSGTPEDLVPHKVTSISFALPPGGEQNLRGGTKFDLVFLLGALATGLLIAGGVVQVIDRLCRLHRPAPPERLPRSKAKRSNHDALSSKGTTSKERRERLIRSNIPLPRPRETPVFSGLSRTTVEQRQRAAGLRSPSFLDTK